METLKLTCTEEQKALLDLGDHVITQVKSVLGPVPLNQWGKSDYQDKQKRLEKIETEKNGLLAFANIWTFRDLLRVVSDLRKNEPGAAERQKLRFEGGRITEVYNNANAAHRPKVVAAAIAFCGETSPRAMCQDYAALGYLLLKESLPSPFKVSYIYDSGINHFFCAIGDFKNDKENCIIIDPWYVYGKAILWKHSRHGKQGWGEAIYIKDCVGNGTEKEISELLQSLRTRYEGDLKTVFEVNREWYTQTRAHYDTLLLDPDFWLGMQYRMTIPSSDGATPFDYTVA